MLKQTLRPGEARMLSIRKVQKAPQVLSTNRHIMQGYYELSDVKWNGNRLVGKAKVVAGEPFIITLALNGRQPFDTSSPIVSSDGKLAVLTLESTHTKIIDWGVRFK